ncbi:DUF5706 domain-containing protein [Streptomyces sp. MRC013]|uniref:Pycsar system effector family protein n=1 Tax=Streptomyces sp. MRC013 TaxID=2898276 RepID=UPI002026DFCE|nr:Pycsar system effector family protein [Streptomyces sp. MRC013]URM89226.1 DUF5706 domain-containing protein [Streptomyces sp. MRC013]
MSGTGGAPASPDEVRALAERLLSTVREDIGRADTKAAILLSGALAFLAVVFARNPAYLTAHGFAAVLVALAVALWSVGMLMLVAVVLPRTRIGADRTLLRDLIAGAPVGALLDRLTEAGADTTSWLLDQASVHGQVLAAKYRWLRAGVLCLALGAALALSSELW